MFTSDYRMVQGQPLHYYPPYGGLDRDPFPYFRRFESYRPQMDIPEEIILPSSPNSIQSDSDNSVSSVEISPTPIRSQNNIIKNTEKTEVQCRWRSCGIHFTSLDQLATHVAKVHSASGVGGLFYCGWEGCTRNDKGFNARYKMLVHVRTHTNEKPHKCFQCDKSFSRAENLKIHSRSHSGEKPYVCPVPGCNKAYSNSSDRFKHTRTHQVDKPYQCKVPGCSKRYTDPSSLRKHVKTYKHFVTDSLDKNQKPVEVVKEVSMMDDRFVNAPAAQIYRENVIRHPCNCNRMCCVSNCLNSTADLFRIGALLNLKQEENTWNQYIDPYIAESKFTPYEVRREETIDLDAPLDLSVHAREF